MKRLLFLLMLTGCGVQNTPHPNIVQKTVGIHDPRVVVVGDSTMTAWLTPAVLAAHPLWTAQTSPEGVEETSTQILARLPAAIALHPDVIVLESGVWDMDPPGCCSNTICTEGVSEVCSNITTMVQEIQAADIYVLVCTIPPWGVGPLSTQIDVSEIRLANIDTLVQFIQNTYGVQSVPNVATVDFYGQLANPGEDGQNDYQRGDGSGYVPTYTTDGVNPNAAGGQVMTQAATQAITATNRGGAL